MPRIEPTQPVTVETFPVSFMLITHDMDAKLLQGFMDTMPKGAEVCILHNSKGEEESLSEVEVTQHGTLTIRLRRWVYVGDFHFAQARNLCDELATNEWCMWLDTDDRLMHCQHSLLRKFATECPAGYGGAWAGVCSYEPSFEPGGKGRITSAYQLRLYRKSVGARWEGRVHEQIHSSIQGKGYNTAETSVIINHVGYMGSNESRIAKLRRNFDLLTKQVAEGASSPFLQEFFEDALQDTGRALLDYKRIGN